MITHYVKAIKASIKNPYCYHLVRSIYGKKYVWHWSDKTCFLYKVSDDFDRSLILKFAPHTLEYLSDKYFLKKDLIEKHLLEYLCCHAVIYPESEKNILKFVDPIYIETYKKRIEIFSTELQTCVDNVIPFRRLK